MGCWGRGGSSFVGTGTGEVPILGCKHPWVPILGISPHPWVSPVVLCVLGGPIPMAPHPWVLGGGHTCGYWFQGGPFLGWKHPRVPIFGGLPPPMGAPWCCACPGGSHTHGPPPLGASCWGGIPLCVYSWGGPMLAAGADAMPPHPWVPILGLLPPPMGAGRVLGGFPYPWVLGGGRTHPCVQLGGSHAGCWC